MPPAIAHLWTSRADGDFSGDHPPAWPAAPRPWTTLRQVHGARAVVVEQPGQHAGEEADAAVTDRPGCVLAVRSADCAPLVLEGDRAVGVIHAGWRGLLAGVVAATAAAMDDLGSRATTARIGPCIRPGCYEFQGSELDALAHRFGPQVRARTAWGTEALDLPAAVVRACHDAGVADVRDEAPCTACDRRWFSHRAHRDTARFATLAWVCGPDGGRP